MKLPAIVMEEFYDAIYSCISNPEDVYGILTDYISEQYPLILNPYELDISCNFHYENEGPYRLGINGTFEFEDSAVDEFLTYYPEIFI